MIRYEAFNPNHIWVKCFLTEQRGGGHFSPFFASHGKIPPLPQIRVFNKKCGKNMHLPGCISILVTFLDWPSSKKSVFTSILTLILPERGHWLCKFKRWNVWKFVRILFFHFATKAINNFAIKYWFLFSIDLNSYYSLHAHYFTDIPCFRLLVNPKCAIISLGATLLARLIINIIRF